MYLIPIKLVELRVCPLDDVFDELLFITDRKSKGRGGGYSDHFQFSIISIREEDYEIIFKCASKNLKLATKYPNYDNP